MADTRRPAGTVRIGMKRRAGRKVRNHLYDQLGPEPADSDPSIGWSRDPDIVLAVVRAINDGEAIPGAQWWCAGGPDAALIYDRQTDDIAGGWVLAVRSRDDADRIVAAVNGSAKRSTKTCHGLHCKCMNIGGICPDPHHGDHDCPYGGETHVVYYP